MAVVRSADEIIVTPRETRALYEGIDEDKVIRVRKQNTEGRKSDHREKLNIPSSPS